MDVWSARLLTLILHITHWTWTTNGCMQMRGSRNLQEAWSTVASIGMWNIWKYRCLNRYSRETHTIAKAITNYMDWSSGILVCTIWKPTGRLRTSRVGMSTIYLTLGNHTIGGLHVMTFKMMLLASSLALPPTNKSPILLLVISMSSFVQKLAVVFWCWLKNNRFCHATTCCYVDRDCPPPSSVTQR